MTRSDWPSATSNGGQADHGQAIHQRVAVVGCGRRFATSVAPTLREVRSVVALAVDPDPQAHTRVTQIASSDANLILSTTLDREQLIDSGVDAVIICSPSGLHFEHCEIGLSCGLPTFVEKPLACTVPEAVHLRAASQGLLAASEQRVHREDLAYAREVIQSGRLGELTELYYHDSMVPAPHFASTWRNDPELAGGGILLDLGYHTVGSVQWLLGVRSQGMAVTQAHLTTGTLQVEEAAQIACTADGIKIALDIRLVSASPREIIVAKGSQGELRLERERKRPPVSEIFLAIDGCDPDYRQMRLKDSTDSKSLLDFLCGRTEASWLRRHVDALEFLGQVYAYSGQ
jgi:predicted dehydrogenase